MRKSKLPMMEVDKLNQLKDRIVGLKEWNDLLENHFVPESGSCPIPNDKMHTKNYIALEHYGERHYFKVEADQTEIEKTLIDKKDLEYLHTEIELLNIRLERNEVESLKKLCDRLQIAIFDTSISVENRKIANESRKHFQRQINRFERKFQNKGYEEYKVGDKIKVTDVFPICHFFTENDELILIERSVLDNVWLAAPSRESFALNAPLRERDENAFKIEECSFVKIS